MPCTAPAYSSMTLRRRTWTRSYADVSQAQEKQRQIEEQRSGGLPGEIGFRAFSAAKSRLMAPYTQTVVIVSSHESRGAPQQTNSPLISYKRSSGPYSRHVIVPLHLRKHRQRQPCRPRSMRRKRDGTELIYQPLNILTKPAPLFEVTGRTVISSILRC